MRNGDSWRWDTARHTYQRSQYISVIEHPKEADAPPRKHNVPFGFSPRDPEPEPEWEGNPS